MSDANSREELGFVDYKPDCSMVHLYRTAEDWRLVSSTQFTPMFSEKCNAAFSRRCSHCGAWHNFIAKPGLAHICGLHNRRHESAQDLELVLAEAEREYVEQRKATRAATAKLNYDPDKALRQFLTWYCNEIATPKADH
jgi:hypothetical protein